MLPQPYLEKPIWRKFMPSITEAKSVRCPNCQAEPGQRCVGSRRNKTGCHLERHTFYKTIRFVQTTDRETLKRVFKLARHQLKQRD